MTTKREKRFQSLDDIPKEPFLKRCKLFASLDPTSSYAENVRDDSFFPFAFRDIGDKENTTVKLSTEVQWISNAIQTYQDEKLKLEQTITTDIQREILLANPGIPHLMGFFSTKEPTFKYRMMSGICFPPTEYEDETISNEERDTVKALYIDILVCFFGGSGPAKRSKKEGIPPLPFKHTVGPKIQGYIDSMRLFEIAPTSGEQSIESKQNQTTHIRDILKITTSSRIDIKTNAITRQTNPSSQITPVEVAVHYIGMYATQLAIELEKWLRVVNLTGLILQPGNEMLYANRVMMFSSRTKFMEMLNLLYLYFTHYIVTQMKKVDKDLIDTDKYIKPLTQHKRAYFSLAFAATIFIELHAMNEIAAREPTTTFEPQDIYSENIITGQTDPFLKYVKEQIRAYVYSIREPNEKVIKGGFERHLTFAAIYPPYLYAPAAYDMVITGLANYITKNKLPHIQVDVESLFSFKIGEVKEEYNKLQKGEPSTEMDEGPQVFLPSPPQNMDSGSESGSDDNDLKGPIESDDDEEDNDLKDVPIKSDADEEDNGFANVDSPIHNNDDRESSNDDDEEEEDKDVPAVQIAAPAFPQKAQPVPKVDTAPPQVLTPVDTTPPKIDYAFTITANPNQYIKDHPALDKWALSVTTTDFITKINGGLVNVCTALFDKYKGNAQNGMESIEYIPEESTIIVFLIKTGFIRLNNLAIVEPLIAFYVPLFAQKFPIQTIKIICANAPAQIITVVSELMGRKPDIDYNNLSNTLRERLQKIQNLQTEVDKFQTEKDGLNASIEQTNKMLEKLKLQNDTLTADKNKADELAQQATNKATNLQAQFIQLGFKDVTQHLRGMQQKDDTIKELEGQIRELTGEISKHLQDEGHLEKEILILKATIEANAITGDKEEGVKTNTKQELATTKARLNDSIAQRTIISNELNLLKETSKGEINKRDAFIKQLDIELGEARDQLAIEIKNTAKIVEEVKQYKMEVQKLRGAARQDAAALTTAADTRQDIIKTGIKATAALKIQQELNEGLAKKYKELEKQKTDTSAIEADLKRAREETERLKQSIKRITDTSTNQLLELNKLKEEKNGMEKELGKLREAPPPQDMSAKDKEIEELRKQLAAAQVSTPIIDPDQEIIDEENNQAAEIASTLFREALAAQKRKAAQSKKKKV